MATAENPNAGQGPVLLDIGGDVGALVVSMPASTDGLEVEIRPAGTTARGEAHHHDHDHPDDHDHTHVAHPHVGVVGRPNGAGIAYTLVYPAVPEGDYELVPLPDGAVVLTATVSGGTVTRATWPGD